MSSLGPIAKARIAAVQARNRKFDEQDFHLVMREERELPVFELDVLSRHEPEREFGFGGSFLDAPDEYEWS